MTDRSLIPYAPPQWTIDTYVAHNEAMRQVEAQAKAAEEKFLQERDRRYAEVDVEKEKALKIKETADLAALQLARDIQIYKDEKANELREQINSERGLYATKDDLAALAEKLEATVRPLTLYMTRFEGRSSGVGATWAQVMALVVAAATVAGFVARVWR